jgi:EAL domain-containing protein (putative c-di-GMP-specific phosphodiesterase class I)
MSALKHVSPLSHFLAAGPEASVDSGDTAIDRILDAVRLHLGMDIAFASRFIQGRREFTHIRAGIPVPAAPGDSEPLEDSFCQRILEGRLPELILDASLYPAAHEVPLTAALPIGSHLNVPLRLSDGEIYGTFCCISRIPDLTLTERDLSTLRAFADLAAGQIELGLNRQRRSDETLAQICSAFEPNGMTMVHQPIHRLADGRPVGVECLARFPGSPGRPPSDWFEAAADIGRGAELELCAVRLALEGLPYVPPGLYMAVNVSPETILSGALLPLLGKAPPGRIVVEVTEHARVPDYGALRAALDALRGHVRIAIDDVGAGYSGLRHIVDLQPDILKLDMSLTRDVDRDPARRALTQAMVALAQEIGSCIVAEGVETEGERATLAALGVGYAQGYHFSRPMPAVAAQQFLLGIDTIPPSVSKQRPSRLALSA